MTTRRKSVASLDYPSYKSTSTAATGCSTRSKLKISPEIYGWSKFQREEKRMHLNDTRFKEMQNGPIVNKKNAKIASNRRVESLSTPSGSPKQTKHSECVPVYCQRPFRPSINRKSREICQERAGVVEDILLQWNDSKSRKIEQLQKEEILSEEQTIQSKPRLSRSTEAIIKRSNRSHSVPIEKSLLNRYAASQSRISVHAEKICHQETPGRPKIRPFKFKNLDVKSKVVDRLVTDSEFRLLRAKLIDQTSKQLRYSNKPLKRSKSTSDIHERLFREAKLRNQKREQMISFRNLNEMSSVRRDSRLDISERSREITSQMGSGLRKKSKYCTVSRPPEFHAFQPTKNTRSALLSLTRSDFAAAHSSYQEFLFRESQTKRREQTCLPMQRNISDVQSTTDKITPALDLEPRSISRTASVTRFFHSAEHARGLERARRSSLVEKMEACTFKPEIQRVQLKENVPMDEKQWQAVEIFMRRQAQARILEHEKRGKYVTGENWTPNSTKPEPFILSTTGRSRHSGGHTKSKFQKKRRKKRGKHLSTHAKVQRILRKKRAKHKRNRLRKSSIQSQTSDKNDGATIIFPVRKPARRGSVPSHVRRKPSARRLKSAPSSSILAAPRKQNVSDISPEHGTDPFEDIESKSPSDSTQPRRHSSPVMSHAIPDSAVLSAKVTRSDRRSSEKPTTKITRLAPRRKTVPVKKRTFLSKKLPIDRMDEMERLSLMVQKCTNRHLLAHADFSKWIVPVPKHARKSSHIDHKPKVSPVEQLPPDKPQPFKHETSQKYTEHSKRTDVLITCPPPNAITDEPNSPNSEEPQITAEILRQHDQEPDSLVGLLQTPGEKLARLKSHLGAHTLTECATDESAESVHGKSDHLSDHSSDQLGDHVSDISRSDSCQESSSSQENGRIPGIRNWEETGADADRRRQQFLDKFEKSLLDELSIPAEKCSRSDGSSFSGKSLSSMSGTR
eukprot:29022_1